jgi:hypothetical protein
MILNFVCILKAEKNADTWVLTPEILGVEPPGLSWKADWGMRVLETS